MEDCPMLKLTKKKLIVFITMFVLLLAGCVNTEEGNGTLGTPEVSTQVPSSEATATPKPTSMPQTSDAPEPTITPEASKKPEVTATPEIPENTVSSSFEIHYIDCGQGDSILLRSENETMLIDASNNKDGEAIVSYLKNQGIKKLDYVVGTHPDADHIGGLDTVINSLSIGKVYMPKKQNNTKTFEDVLTAIKNKGLKISSPKPGTEITLGDVKLTILGPINYYDDDNNNNSIVIRAVHGQNSFLFMGDAELQEETDLIDAGVNLNATVLKVGHHGSSSSTSRYFLDKVNPKYAVISCGEDNKYGHPHKETLTYLEMFNTKVYRTDLEKTIIMKSDGSNLDISTGNASAIGKSTDKSPTSSKNEGTQIKDDTSKNDTDKNTTGSTGTSYIGNINSHKFHVTSCSSLPAEKNRVYFKSREEAISKGYEPCKRCKP